MQESGVAFVLFQNTDCTQTAIASIVGVIQSLCLGLSSNRKKLALLVQDAKENAVANQKLPKKMMHSSFQTEKRILGKLVLIYKRI